LGGEEAVGLQRSLVNLLVPKERKINNNKGKGEEKRKKREEGTKDYSTMKEKRGFSNWEGGKKGFKIGDIAFEEKRRRFWCCYKRKKEKEKPRGGERERKNTIRDGSTSKS